MREAPNEQIVDRAVELWKRALADPVYDNGGDGLASVLAGMAKQNSTADVLEAFGVALKAALMTPGQYGYLDILSVDYDPDPTLRAAAEKAGLLTKFPWKTRMFINPDCVAFSQGYGAPDVYHYPLPDGRWLVTRLRGEDIAEVIKLVMGEAPNFTVEGADHG